jgi:eukaryotic-like serine/threonine-protein kinase
LWEMLAGRRLFEGKTTSDVLAAVIRDEPDLECVPVKVRPLLKRCLEKDPARRLRDIGDAMGIVESTAETATARITWAAWAVAALFILAFVALAFVHFRETPPEARVTTTSILPPENTNFDFGGGLIPAALSPDGRWIVFGAHGTDGKTQLWLRPLDASTAQLLAGTENARFPFWSPDSRSIGFFAEGKLKRLDVRGGPALPLADAPTPRGGSWGMQGVIVFGPNNAGPLQRIAAGGGTPARATAVSNNDSGHTFPWFLPDGRHFLFAAVKLTGGIDLRIGDIDTLEVKNLGRGNSNAVYAGGYLLYLRESTLMAQAFDEQRWATIGEPEPIAEQVWSARGTFDRGSFSVSRTGQLAYYQGPADSQQLTWFDRVGRRVGTLGEPGDYTSAEISPDGKRVAVIRHLHMWIYDVARGLPTRFTFSPASDGVGIWSPDGKNIIYRSNAKGLFDLYRKAADGTGTEDLLYADDASKTPGSWSPDGRLLLFYRLDPKTQRDIWILPLDNPSKAYAWLAMPYDERLARFSPNGRWVAYESNESGRYEIYGAPFPGPGGKRQISAGGGELPRWRADNKEIFYVAPDGKLMAAEVSIKGSSIDVGAIRPLGIPVILNGPYPFYDVAADGQRFLVAAPHEQQSSTPLTLVQNWTALLKKK